MAWKNTNPNWYSISDIHHLSYPKTCPINFPATHEGRAVTALRQPNRFEIFVQMSLKLSISNARFVCGRCRQALNSTAKRRRFASAAAPTPEIYDIVTVGGGPAGLALLAALSSYRLPHAVDLCV